MEHSYPQQMGSLLRCGNWISYMYIAPFIVCVVCVGSRLTYFANQVLRFADLYSSTCVNLVNYPNHYLFNSPHQLVNNNLPLYSGTSLTVDTSGHLYIMDTVLYPNSINTVFNYPSELRTPL